MSTKLKMSRDDFSKSIVAQKDDEDYSESGYVAFIFEGVAYLASYSHCSCFGTYDALCGGVEGDYIENGELNVEWSGSIKQLLKLAENDADPTFPDRKNSNDDHDVCHLRDVYEQLLQKKEQLLLSNK